MWGWLSLSETRGDRLKEEITFFKTVCEFINESLPAILLAMFGGAVNMLNSKDKQFSWRWFFIGIITAGFVGYVMSTLMCGYGVNEHVSKVAIAISGYSANDILRVLKEKLIERITNHDKKSV